MNDNTQQLTTLMPKGNLKGVAITLVAALAAQLDGTPQLTDRLRQDFMRNNALALFPRFS